MTMLRRYSMLLVVVLGLQAPDPDYIGPEDPAHAGQPRTCTNTPHRKAVKHDCPCHPVAACDKDKRTEDSKCMVYCRKPACFCDHGCETE